MEKPAEPREKAASRALWVSLSRISKCLYEQEHCMNRCDDNSLINYEEIWECQCERSEICPASHQAALRGNCELPVIGSRLRVGYCQFDENWQEVSSVGRDASFVTFADSADAGAYFRSSREKIQKRSRIPPGWYFLCGPKRIASRQGVLSLRERKYQRDLCEIASVEGDTEELARGYAISIASIKQ